MTITTSQYFTDWMNADGANKDWSYNFPIRAQEDIYIQTKDSAGLIVETQLNLMWYPTNDDEGYVQYPNTGAALAAGWAVRIVRRLPYTQEAEIGNEGSFRPEIHEAAFDRATQQIQQVAGETLRAVKVPLGYTAPSLDIIAEDHFILMGPDNKLIDGGPGDAIRGAQAQAEAAIEAREGAEVARDAAIAAQPQSFPVNRPALAALPDTVVNSYLVEAGFEGYFRPVNTSSGDYDDLIAADTAGGEIKVSTANPNLAWLRTRKNGDLFKTSEEGDSLFRAAAVAGQRIASGELTRATIDLNTKGTMVATKGIVMPPGVELIGSGKTVLDFSTAAAGDLITLSGIIGNCCLYTAGAGLTAVGVGFADTVYGDTHLAFNAAHGFLPGDIISLHRTADYSWGVYDAGTSTWTGYRPYYQAGQRNRVVAVEGNTVYLEYALLLNYSVNAPYATTIYKQACATGRYGGFAVHASGSAVDQTALAFFRHLDRAEVEDIEALGATYIGIGFGQCIDVRPRNLRAATQVRSSFAVAPPSSSGNDYALLISNSTNVVVCESTGVGNWAAADIGGGAGAGATVNYRVGYDDCVLSANRMIAAGMHGNAWESGYHRCRVNGGMSLAGESPHGTDCIVDLYDSPITAVLTGAEMRGGVYDISGSKFSTSKDSGPNGTLNFQGNLYLGNEPTIYGRGVELYAPNTVRPIFVVSVNDSYSISVDLEITKHTLKSDAFFVLYCSRSASLSAKVARCNKLMMGKPPGALPYAAFGASYSAAEYKYPTQFGTATIAGNTGTSTVSQAVTLPNRYPVVPFYTVTPVDGTAGGDAAIPYIVGSEAITGVTVGLRTADGGNFASTATGRLRWKAEF